MTELEVAKQIVKQGNCKNLNCEDCPAHNHCSSNLYDETVRANSSGVFNDVTKAMSYFNQYISDHEKPKQFEVGHWYERIGGSEKGVGQFKGYADNDNKVVPCFYYPSWNKGHNGNTWLYDDNGLTGNHCWFEFGDCFDDYKEVPKPSICVNDIWDKVLGGVNCRCSLKPYQIGRIGAPDVILDNSDTVVMVHDYSLSKQIRRDKILHQLTTD